MEMNNLSLLRDGKSSSVDAMHTLIRDYFESHKGEVKYAFLTTYDGMDMTVLEDLLLSVPGGNRLVFNGDFDVCCGAKKALLGVENSYLSEMLLARVHRVCVENAFHPKIYLFYYLPEGESEKRIFLIISSKNITKHSFLDAYVCFEGVKAGGNTNGKQLKDILTTESFLGTKELAEEIETALKDLPEYQFSSFDNNAKVSFHRPDEKLLVDIITHVESEPKPIIVSPFVTNVMQEKDICLYTSEETIQSLTEKPTGGCII